jgi:hypothetical protein
MVGVTSETLTAARCQSRISYGEDDCPGESKLIIIDKPGAKIQQILPPLADAAAIELHLVKDSDASL